MAVRSRRGFAARPCPGRLSSAGRRPTPVTGPGPPQAAEFGRRRRRFASDLLRRRSTGAGCRSPQFEAIGARYRSGTTSPTRDGQRRPAPPKEPAGQRPGLRRFGWSAFAQRYHISQRSPYVDPAAVPDNLAAGRRVSAVVPLQPGQPRRGSVAATATPIAAVPASTANRTVSAPREVRARGPASRLVPRMLPR